MSAASPKVRLYKGIKNDVRRLLVRFLSEYEQEKPGYKAPKFKKNEFEKEVRRIARETVNRIA